jgi:hypothetical protein
MNVSNSVFYRSLCAFQPFVPSFCGGQAYTRAITELKGSPEFARLDRLDKQVGQRRLHERM